MQLTIEQVKPGEKSTGLKVGDKWYRIQNAKLGKIAAGMTINATIKLSEHEGKTYHWVDSYSAEESAAPVAPKASGNDRWWAPFVSNVVAHAIAGGQIESHDKIRLWSSAAYSAIQALDKGDETPF